MSELAGEPAPRETLVNIPRLISQYYTTKPDPENSTQMVSFGTSGHSGSSFKASLSKTHILTITQAICEYRISENISGPLYMGMDTHALSESAFITALEVFAAKSVVVRIQTGRGYTPTPAISHAILTYNRERTGDWQTE